MATHLFPLPATPHTAKSLVHAHRSQETHTHTHTEAPGLYPVQDKLNPQGRPANFEKSVPGPSLFQTILGEFQSNNLAFFPVLTQRFSSF